MAKHIIKANIITSEVDKISVIRKLQYTSVWGFDPLDLVTKQYVDDTIAGSGGFILNQNSIAQVGNFRITGTGEATTFKVGNFLINESTVSNDHMQWSTGVYSYAGLTITSPTTFDIGAFSGYVVDNTNPQNPIITPVNYPGSTGNTTPFLGSSPATFIYADAAGVITLSNTPPSEPLQRSVILLGALGHPAGALLSVTNKTDVIFAPLDQVRDMFRPIKYINDGVQVSPNGANLSFNTSSGKLYGLGIGFVTNGKNQPSSLNIPSASPATFQYRTQTGVSGADTTLIVPGSYDVAGTVTPVGGGAGSSTNQRIYLSETGVIRVQYGQTVYATLAEAISASNTEPFVVFANNRLFGILIAIVSVVKTATNLSDPAQARILSVSKFGESVGGAAGLATGSLQTAYNNSASPEITTNTTNLALTIKRGSTLDTDKVFEIQNGAGTVTSSIDGNGLFTANDILSTTTIRATTSSRADVSFLVGTGAGTQGGNDNLVKPFNATGFLNVKGGSGFAKISIGDTTVDIIGGGGSITFRSGANSSTSLGTTRGTMFNTGNFSLSDTPADNGFKFEVVGTSRFAGTTTVGTNTTASDLRVNGPAGVQRALFLQTAGLNRWAFGTGTSGEGGGNTGSNLAIGRYNDGGTLSENTIIIIRNTGFIGVGNGVGSPLSRFHVDGRITITSPPSNEGIRIVDDSVYISFFNTANSTRSAYIQGSLQDIRIQAEVGNKYVLLNPNGVGNVGIHTVAPQAKLQVGEVNAPGVGEATFKGFIQINSGSNSNSDTGLEFKLATASNGYGKRIIGEFDGSADYDLTFQSRSGSATWVDQVIFRGATASSTIISIKNPIVDNLLYSHSNFEALSSGGAVASYGFHRAGFSGMALYHQDSSTTNLLRIRVNDGNDYNVWHSGNLSPVVSGIATLDQVIINGNISDPPSRYVIIGRVSIGKSGGGYGTIGENYRTTGVGFDYYQNDFATQIDFTSGNINLKTAPSGTAGNPITFTSRLFIKNGPDTNIGIGTITPGFVSAGRTVLSLDGPASSLIEFKVNGGFSGYLFANPANFEIAANVALNFVTGGSSRMFISTTGDVGIGPNAVSNPLSRLHVDSGLITITNTGGENIKMIDDAAYISFYNSANTLRTGFIQGSALGTIFIESEQGNKQLILNGGAGSGNVGIGTVSPTAKLDVNGTFFQSGGSFITDNLQHTIQINGSDALSVDFVGGGGVIELRTVYTSQLGRFEFGPVVQPAATAGKAKLWGQTVSAVVELRCMDGAGNVTTLSPHNSSMIPAEEIIDDMSWFYYSERGHKRINVNMYKAIKLLEQLTGEKLIYQDEKGISGIEAE